MLLEDRYLAVYLQDHLAGATGGLALARRARDSHEGTDLGAFLGELADEIAEDRERLEQIMRFSDVGEDRLKVAGAWAGEKLGRLKLNGEILQSSPLSTIVELEGLYVGVSGKLSLWLNLERAMGEHLQRFDLPGLIARAERQRDRLEQHRLAIVADVLAPASA
jgi:hypothetical protein